MNASINGRGGQMSSCLYGHPSQEKTQLGNMLIAKWVFCCMGCVQKSVHIYACTNECVCVCVLSERRAVDRRIRVVLCLHENKLGGVGRRGEMRRWERREGERKVCWSR